MSRRFGHQDAPIPEQRLMSTWKKENTYSIEVADRSVAGLNRNKGGVVVKTLSVPFGFGDVDMDADSRRRPE